MKTMIITLLSLFLYGTAAAQPSTVGRDGIRIIVPFAAGGTSDLTARILAEAMQTESGLPVVVENRPGGFTAVALEHLMRRPADGRTLFLAANGVVTHRHYLPQSTVDPMNSLSVITMITESPMMLMVTNHLPVRDAREFIEYARVNQHLMNYATVGQGGTLQMGADLMLRATGLSITGVPYQGGAPATVDLIAGRIQMMFDSVAVGMQSHRLGQARAFAVTSGVRSRHAPDIPTFKELGFDIDFTPWQALFVSNTTPDPIRHQLNAWTTRVLNNPAVRARYVELGMEGVLATSVQDSERLLAAEQARWNQILSSPR
jgi:tripartite-type tricarboxylate transporter receptor subunit TctC